MGLLSHNVTRNKSDFRVGATVSAILLMTLVISPVQADMCTLDVVPAATLLLPYFEVDLDDSLGRNTLFTVHNAAPEAVLARAFFWTDLAAPTIAFDFFLTGYDVITFDMHDMFVNGILPITADEPNDPTDTISPHGDPAWEGSFPVCEVILPLSNPAIRSSARDRFVNGHTGNPVVTLSDDCLGATHPSGRIARGYVTIDSVSSCSLGWNPGGFGYFRNGGEGVANNRNQLWGNFLLVEARRSRASAQPLVHIEAEDGFSPPSGYTFYGRFTDGADNREPLGTTWGASYVGNGVPLSKAEFLVWRDTTSSDILPDGVECGTLPSWGPLDETRVLCFDTEEQVTELCTTTSCFPLASQKTSLEALGSPYRSGWCFLDLNHRCPSCEPGGYGVRNNLAQSYVSSIYTADGLIEVGLPMVELSHACDDPDLIGSIFIDNFESGDLNLWTRLFP